MIVNACCILHNIRKFYRLPRIAGELEIENDEEELPNVEDIAIGEEVRTQIIREHFM